jgi:hypothetical protein
MEAHPKELTATYLNNNVWNTEEPNGVSYSFESNEVCPETQENFFFNVTINCN